MQLRVRNDFDISPIDRVVNLWYPDVSAGLKLDDVC